jgi:leucyl-tRNA synthetase
MTKYNHLEIEKKWQDIWAKADIYAAKDFDKKPKFYCLIEFPYPSGEYLHVGHGRSYSALDAMARLKRMQGYNVLFPIGWDAFGLPAENYAIKTSIHPSITTRKNIENSKKQLISWGCSFDWNREINTTDPKYYKWTQWIFLKLYEMGLAYKVKMPINWCPSCKTGLANEEVIDGKCERCGAESERKELNQWMLRITKYADRLIEDLKSVDYLSKIKTQQINWIGRSEGAEILFKAIDTASIEHDLWVFTTRPDTLFGATFMVLAPEHPLVKKLTTVKQAQEVQKYVIETGKKSDLERSELEKDKTGVFTGSFAVNPVNNQKIPIWISDYVLMGYGHGAIMAVPAHDERDFEFAEKYKLPIEFVVAPLRVDKKNPPIGGKSSKERRTIHGVVYNPKTDKYLVLKWKQFDWTTFIVGGVEDGEDLIAAARREILEETGYKNLKFIRKLGNPVRAEYFAAHKDENRVAITTGILFELIDDEQSKVNISEKKKHETDWIHLNEINENNMTCAELDLWLDSLENPEKLFSDYGVLINSGVYNGLNSEDAKGRIVAELSKKKMARKAVNYKLRDWIFSRQHYWGEPIPIIHCAKCGEVPVPIKDLPVELPMVEKYEPTGTGESPLAAVPEWVNTTCPKCGGRAKRETDTMPNWAGSSWYFIRYIDPKNDKVMADPNKMKYWLPVDLYNGGMEHTTLHLLYSRFWYKALFDAGVVPTPEPYQRRHSHGMILGKDNQKMSKSRGNVVNPDEIIKSFGGDTFRTYEMFIGPFEEVAIWDEKGIEGVYRFLNRVWNLFQLPFEDRSPKIEQERAIGKAIKKVEQDILTFRFNTAVSALMILLNELSKEKKQNKEILEKFSLILAPFAPHLAEELWAKLGNKVSIHLQPWPVYDAKILEDESITIAVQVNGKIRDSLLVSPFVTEKEVVKMAKSSDRVCKYIEDKEIKKLIYIKGKILSIVTG